MRNRIQVVVVAVIRQDGKYLLTKRHNPRTKLTHGVWQFAGGGLQFHETITECLHREVREELGISVRISQLIEPVQDSIGDFPGWHGVILYFLCEPSEKNPIVVLNKEASAHQWFSREEIRNLTLHFGTEPVLDAAERLQI